MLEYKIEGGNLPVVICSPESGRRLYRKRFNELDESEHENGNHAGGIKTQSEECFLENQYS